MRTISVGLLPLYIKLYDDVDPSLREKQIPFLREAAAALEAEGLDVLVSVVCRVRPEFERAVAAFNERGVAAVVTLHLAYSPSLEAVDALATLNMPLIALDATPTWDFVSEAGVEAIDRNHGIHGVQDLMSGLRRRGIACSLVAGHLRHSAAARRVADLCRAAQAARAFRHMRVGLVGEPFEGMGDFRVEPEALRAVTGAQVLRLLPEEALAHARRVTGADVDAQVAEDLAWYDAALKHPENHRPAARAGLALRRGMEENALAL
jgi:L-arabinose isomerase